MVKDTLSIENNYVFYENFIYYPNAELILFTSPVITQDSYKHCKFHKLQTLNRLQTPRNNKPDLNRVYISSSNQHTQCPFMILKKTQPKWVLNKLLLPVS